MQPKFIAVVAPLLLAFAQAAPAQAGEIAKRAQFEEGAKVGTDGSGYDWKKRDEKVGTDGSGYDWKRDNNAGADGKDGTDSCGEWCL